MQRRNEAEADDRPLHSESGFVARIEGTDLGYFVQMECMAGATRVLQVESHGRLGYLYLQEGLVVHALADHRVGEEAVYEMLRWTVGTIGSCERPWPAQRSIATSWQGLLLRAAHAADEDARETAKVVPFPDVSAPPPSDPPSRPRISTRPPGDSRMHAPAEARQSIPTGVRLDARGHVVTQRGDVDELAPIAAYAKRVATLIGEDLGLEGFVGLTCKTNARRLVVFVDGEDLVATEPDAKAPIDPLLARLGLD